MSKSKSTPEADYFSTGELFVARFRFVYVVQWSNTEQGIHVLRPVNNRRHEFIFKYP